MRLVVSSKNWARKHKREFDAVITIEDPNTHGGVRFNRHPHPDHLVLRFVDIDYPAPAPYDIDHRFRVAEPHHIQQAIEFGRGRESLLVHCQVGIGRSTAIALAILADGYGHGREQEALQALLAVRPQAVPNLCVVGLADALLERGGALLKVVSDWDSKLPDNQTRRVDNRAAHFLYYGLKVM